MKRLTLIILLFSATRCFGRAWYVSGSGNNALAGNSPANAWQSIAKVNSMFSSFAAGDSILFNRGETFYGSVIVAKSGSAAAWIVIGAYGTGAKPVITGYFTPSAWANNGGGIYETPTPAKYNLNLVTLNNIPQRIAQYPNPDSTIGINTGMLTLESWISNTYATDNQLTASPNWTGAKVVIRKGGYIMERDSITNHSGTSFNYLPGPTINPRNGATSAAPFPDNQPGWGYFFYDDPRMLDQLGEWYLNKSSGNLQMFFGSNNPASYSVKIASLDTGINVKNFNYIKIENLALDGFNLCSIYSQDNSNMTVQNCSMTGSGAKGIFVWNAPNITIDNCQFNNMMSNAIDITGRYVSGAVVSNCTITNTGPIRGMEDQHNDASGKAIYIDILKDIWVHHNRVIKTNYSAIQFQGSNVLIEKNFIDTFCYQKDDGGGIYTYAYYRTNRVIRFNIILNGIGNKNGNVAPKHAEGIYGDGYNNAMEVYNNTIANMSNRGLYFNGTKSAVAYNNLIVSAVGWTQSKPFQDSMYGFKLTNNIFWDYKYTSGNGNVYFNGGLDSPNPPVTGTINQAMNQTGIVDSNTYHFDPLYPKPFYWYFKQKNSGGFTFPAAVNFAGLKAATGWEANGREVLAASWQFLYNDSDAPKAVAYAGRRKNTPDGTIYDEGYLLQPWSGVVLIDQGPITLANKILLNGYIFK